MSSYLSPEDIAADLGVPVNTVYQWFSRGTGPARIKVGRHVRIHRETYRQWISDRTVA